MLKLFNTLTRKKEGFIPLNPPQVGLYTCGPTVYNYAHIGNLRTYIFEDVLKRALCANTFNVTHVMNITDVGHLTSDADFGEDKMEKGAKREGKTVWDIAQFYTDAFKKDLELLHIIEPDIWCKATDHINEQIELITQLEKRGFTYTIADGVYFDTSKDPHYGKLARLDKEGLKAGARVEVVKGKKNSTDFALWKLSNPKGVQKRESLDPSTPSNAEGSRGDSARDDAAKRRQMEWPSPWGVGFPGWHIECSAMAMKYLGETFDIHCGGVDHIPVHHTNEIAQAENATGKQFVKTWMHGEFLLVNEGRMGKSEGNFLTLQSLIDKSYDPLVYRYFTFTAHYRQKLNFSWEALDGAQNALNNLFSIIKSWGEINYPPLSKGGLRGGPGLSSKRASRPLIGCAEFEQRFLDAVNDDLNMPQALAVTWELLKSDYPASAKKASLLKFDQVLGLGLDKIEYAQLEIPTDVQKLINEREQARKDKDWKLADRLRKEIGEKGFIVEDMPDGPKIRSTYGRD